ncbi:MAG: hypothetical protein Q8O38_14420 [Sulfurimicrobium sp.]|nr:hypothetical protein [Sulfurimicrobium sp.]
MQKYQIINAKTGEWHSSRSSFAWAVKRAQKLANTLDTTMAVTDKEGMFHVVTPKPNFVTTND